MPARFERNCAFPTLSQTHPDSSPGLARHVWFVLALHLRCRVVKRTLLPQLLISLNIFASHRQEAVENLEFELSMKQRRDPKRSALDQKPLITAQRLCCRRGYSSFRTCWLYTLYPFDRTVWGRMQSPWWWVLKLLQVLPGKRYMWICYCVSASLHHIRFGTCKNTSHDNIFRSQEHRRSHFFSCSS